MLAVIAALRLAQTVWGSSPNNPAQSHGTKPVPWLPHTIHPGTTPRHKTGAVPLPCHTRRPRLAQTL